MASFFSQASSYFGRTNISANYTITDSSSTPTTHAGLWKIQRAIRSAGGLASLARPSTPNVAANGEGSSDVHENICVLGFPFFIDAIAIRHQVSLDSKTRGDIFLENSGGDPGNGAHQFGLVR